MNHINRLLQSAVTSHRNGDLKRAEALYQKILSHDPNHGDALHLLGQLYRQNNDIEQAVGYFYKAAEARPSNPLFWNNLGKILQEKGNLSESRTAHEKAINLKSDYYEAYFQLGNVFRREGNFEKAVHNYNIAVELQPDFFAAHINLGNSLKELNKFDEAIDHFRTAISIKQDIPEAHNNLGLLLLQANQVEEAIEYFHHALVLKPSIAEVYNNLGNALVRNGEFDDAEAQYSQALRLKPDYADAYKNFGNVLAQQRKFNKAKEMFYQALKLEPDNADAYYSLGTLQRECNCLDEAVSCFEKAIQKKPHFVMALCNFGETMQSMGNLENAELLYDQALAVDPKCSTALGNKVCCMNYNPKHSTQDIFDAHCNWAKRFAQPGSAKTNHENDPNPNRVLRIGYISPDFCQHPAASFFDSLLLHRNRAEFDIFAYAQLTHEDIKTEYFKSSADHWREITAFSDEDVVKLIIEDKIDILIDLAGHTSGNRLKVFSFKPAPIQVSCVGYPNTTGLKTVDYLFTDEITDPEGQEKYFTEKLIRLKSGFCSFSPPESSPPIGSLPALENGYVTFGSTHNLSRLNSELLLLWVDLLIDIPDSKLLIFRNTLSESIKKRYLSLFTQMGINKDRILIENVIPKQGHLAIYNRIDIMLDTFPWSGHTTACESLWMGVPIITIPGDRHAGKMVASVLHQIGLPQHIAETREDFLLLIKSLAENRASLNELRLNLRKQMQESQLCDGLQFCKEVEKEYRAMWLKWCEEREHSEVEE